MASGTAATAALARCAGERVRIAEQAKNLRGLLQGLESCVDDDVPTTAAAQSVAEAAVRLATSCARLDAYGFVAATKYITHVVTPIVDNDGYRGRCTCGWISDRLDHGTHALQDVARAAEIHLREASTAR